MSRAIDVNGESINYPQTGDTDWGGEATEFAIQTSAALGKIGLSSGTTVDVASTLDVTGATTLDSTLTVAGTTTLNGNTNLGNAITDIVTVTAILNVDSGVLYIDPATNKVGINDTTPSEALDVTGNLAVSGSITGASATLTDLTVDTNLIKTISASNFVGINTTSPTVALDVTGNIKSSSQIQIPDGTVSVPGIAPSSETGSGLYKIATNKLGIAINGSRVGEVGVGYGGFTGNIIQVAYNEITTSGVAGSLAIPVDNTIPQQTEGNEIITCSITPKYANSILYVESNCFVGENSNVSDAIMVALFRDSTANAISTSFFNAQPPSSSPFSGGDSFNPIYLLSKVVAGSTASTTFKLRAGGNGPSPIRWNGCSNSQFFNGSLITYIRIIEVQI